MTPENTENAFLTQNDETASPDGEYINGPGYSEEYLDAYDDGADGDYPPGYYEDYDGGDYGDDFRGRPRGKKQKSDKSAPRFKEKKEPRGKDLKKTFSFILGLAVLAFAVTGVVLSVLAVKGRMDASKEKKLAQELGKYDTLLIPVAAADPKGFDDISLADMSELVNISVWSIIGSDLDPEKYDYSSGELAVPKADVEEAYVSYFGASRQIEHLTVEGYGYEFRYSAEDGVYYIPLTAVTPVYTPRCGSVTERGDTVSVSCGLVNSLVWMQDSSSGDISAPSPDKTITVTFRTSGGSAVITAIQGGGLPETAPGVTYSAETETSSAPEEESETIVITRY